MKRVPSRPTWDRAPRPEHTNQSDGLARKLGGLHLIVEAVNIVLVRQYVPSAQIPKPVADAIGGAATDRFGLSISWCDKEIAQRLQSGVRVYDGIEVCGGEEFLLALPGCELKPAMARAESLRSVVSERSLTVASNEEKVMISLGVTVASRHSYGTPDELLHRAEVALYEAKANGEKPC